MYKKLECIRTNMNTEQPTCIKTYMYKNLHVQTTRMGVTNNSELNFFVFVWNGKRQRLKMERQCKIITFLRFP